MKLTRAAFALMIKFSEYFDEFNQIVDMVELRSDEMTSLEETEKIMAEILADFKNLSHI
jgi:predicted metal-dependent enzyme (double-stranded beta helix superfamily)